MEEIISVNDVRKTYNDAPALQGISFKVEASELTVIIGPSGCGKSTLLRCLNGLEVFDSGRIKIGDIALERHNGTLPRNWNSQLRELREQVGMVFQSFNLFPHLTVLANAIKAPMVVKGISRKDAEAHAREL